MGSIQRFTESQESLFLTELEGGSSIVHAARKAGTTKARVGKVVALAADAEMRLVEEECLLDDLTPMERWAIEFYVNMQKATGQLEQRLIDLIVVRAEGPKGDWRAAAWMLERLFPERWAKRPIEPKPQTPTNVTYIGTQIQGPDAIMAEARKIAEAAMRGQIEAEKHGMPDTPELGPVVDIEEVAIPVSLRKRIDAEADEELYDAAGI